MAKGPRQILITIFQSTNVVVISTELSKNFQEAILLDIGARQWEGKALMPNFDY